MGSKNVVNPDFFKSKATVVSPKAEVKKVPEKKNVNISLSEPVTINPKILKVAQDLRTLLEQMKQRALLEELNKVLKSAERERFTVSVVGEFSRGKSTFINRLLEKECLPVANLPTTAMLTRIRYNQSEQLVYFDKQGNRQKNVKLTEEAWDGLTASIDGNDPKGVVLVGLKNDWLGENCIEIIDTPGAGDLEESRAKLIGDALLRSDAAIITISADKALSMSEKLFIEQRLIAKKTPFLMLIVTKLDNIPVGQRTSVISYIENKLALWNMDIPVYIPYDIEIPDNPYRHCMGMDKVKKQIELWKNSKQRVELIEDWLSSRIHTIAQQAAGVCKEQLMIAEAEEDKKKELLSVKNQKLIDAEIAWEDLRLQMMERCNECCKKLQNKADECTENIVEKFQYDISHVNVPRKWWKEDYPYRAKIEMTNMSTTIENTISRVIAEDARWFNQSLEAQFKTHILCEKTTISEKELFGDFKDTKELQFEDLEKQRSLFRIGTAVLTIAGAAICASTGTMVLLATTGIGTGAGLFSDSFFKGKIEQQREVLKDAIKKQVPKMIDEAMQQSEGRVKAVYNQMVTEAVAQEKTWMAAQKEILQSSAELQKPEKAAELEEYVKTLDMYCERISEIKS